MGQNCGCFGGDSPPPKKATPKKPTVGRAVISPDCNETHSCIHPSCTWSGKASDVYQHEANCKLLKENVATKLFSTEDFLDLETIHAHIIDTRQHVAKVLIETSKPKGDEDENMIPHVLNGLASYCGAFCTFGETTLDHHTSQDMNLKLKDAQFTDPKEYTKRIAQAHGVDDSRVQVSIIKEGSVDITYTVNGLTKKEKKAVLDGTVNKQYDRLFNSFAHHKAHAGAFVMQFRLADFDMRGTREFKDSGPSNASTYKIGGETYVQPKNWSRVGMDVKKHKTPDHWLDPFSHANNWVRAFHGVCRSAQTQTEVRNVLHSIQKGGLKASTTEGGKYHAVYGDGVYVTPYIDYAEEYAVLFPVNMETGIKYFKVVYQVALRPNTTMDFKTGRGDNFKTGLKGTINMRQWKDKGGVEWLVYDKTNVRPYGLLFKETTKHTDHAVQQL